jgi:antitoxin ParD1/3/4
MQTMNIALPDSLKDYVQKQVEEQGYSSASEYVRELIRAAQKEQARQALETEI